MIRQICNVRLQDSTRSNELLVWLGIEDLDLILKERRLRWYGHMEHSNGAVKTAFDIQVDGKVVLGGSRWHGNSWQRGIAESGSSRLSTLMIDIPRDLVWDLPCMQQASYLEEGPLVWMLPLYMYLHVNQKSDYDDMMIWFHLSTAKNEINLFKNDVLIVAPVTFAPAGAMPPSWSPCLVSELLPIV